MSAERERLEGHSAAWRRWGPYLNERAWATVREDYSPVFGNESKFQDDPHWRDYLSFYEYFHGDDGSGLGASHQTGWTGLLAELLQREGEGRS